MVANTSPAVTAPISGGGLVRSSREVMSGQGALKSSTACAVCRSACRSVTYRFHSVNAATKMPSKRITSPIAVTGSKRGWDLSRFTGTAGVAGVAGIACHDGGSGSGGGAGRQGTRFAVVLARAARSLRFVDLGG